METGYSVDICDAKTSQIKMISGALPQLVLGAVFKTVGPYVNRAAGGFDSHALPPIFSSNSSRTLSHYPNSPRAVVRSQLVEI